MLASIPAGLQFRGVSFVFCRIVYNDRPQRLRLRTKPAVKEDWAKLERSLASHDSAHPCDVGAISPPENLRRRPLRHLSWRQTGSTLCLLRSNMSRPSPMRKWRPTGWTPTLWHSFCAVERPCHGSTVRKARQTEANAWHRMRNQKLDKVARKITADRSSLKFSECLFSPNHPIICYSIQLSLFSSLPQFSSSIGLCRSQVQELATSFCWCAAMFSMVGGIGDFCSF